LCISAISSLIGTLLLWVAYLLAADSVAGPLPSRPRAVQPPVLSTRPRVSQPQPWPWARLGAHGGPRSRRPAGRVPPWAVPPAPPAAGGGGHARPRGAAPRRGVPSGAGQGGRRRAWGQTPVGAPCPSVPGSHPPAAP